jgi:hypothetical protein
VLTKSRLTAVLCALLLPVVPAYAAPQQGQAPLATMNISGAVTVNGRPASQPATIFPGDTIQTGPASFASIVSNNLEVTVPENSSLKFDPATLTFGCGSSSVFTKAGKVLLQTQSGATITPTAEDGFNKIEVIQGAGVTRIRVILGSASVTQGDQSTPLRSGSEIELPGSPCTAPVSSSLTSGGAGAQPAGQAGGTSSAWIPLVIAAGGGGAAAAVLVSREGDHPPVSPSRP